MCVGGLECGWVWVGGCSTLNFARVLKMISYICDEKVYAMYDGHPIHFLLLAQGMTKHLACNKHVFLQAQTLLFLMKIITTFMVTK